MATHLSYEDTINLGSFYTDDEITNIVWQMIENEIMHRTTIIDTSCGYGNFLRNRIDHRIIGADIDNEALEIALIENPTIEIFRANALENVSREKYHIKENEKLCIIGNPPYNDITSQIRNRIKTVNFNIDSDIKTRDLGISFLLSYNKLKADCICVLHPLSYLIKEANFKLLNDFTANYKLKQALVFSSEIFAKTSRSIFFPIVIALYKRDEQGMDYNFIKNYQFPIHEKQTYFCLNDFDYIGRYIEKYPKKNAVHNGDAPLFYTMRDINALKRNRTFLHEFIDNAVIVDIKNLLFYVYVDVFKDFTRCLPYYMGNCDIVIDLELFERFKKYFILFSLHKNPFLTRWISNKEEYDIIEVGNKIDEYFRLFLRGHYES